MSVAIAQESMVFLSPYGGGFSGSGRPELAPVRWDEMPEPAHARSGPIISTRIGRALPVLPTTRGERGTDGEFDGCASNIRLERRLWKDMLLVSCKRRTFQGIVNIK